MAVRLFSLPGHLGQQNPQVGAIRLLDCSSLDMPAGSSSLNQPKFSLGSIINGAQVAYIHQWAPAATAWGYPMFLHFDWEMNGDWFPWSEQVNGNAAGQYEAAWRPVHDIFG